MKRRLVCIFSLHQRLPLRGLFSRLSMILNPSVKIKKTDRRSTSYSTVDAAKNGLEN